MVAYALKAYFRPAGDVFGGSREPRGHSVRYHVVLVSSIVMSIIVLHELKQIVWVQT